jgi:hypothetical protein
MSNELTRQEIEHEVEHHHSPCRSSRLCSRRPVNALRSGKTGGIEWTR